MWPALFGAGWVWGALVAAALLCFVIGVLGFLLLITMRPSRQAADELDRAWHLYEEGDLTHAEWQRRVRALRSSRASRRLIGGPKVQETGGI
jgi:hypothetical protein